MYKPAMERTLKDLKDRKILFQVDATKLDEFPQKDFDRIVWNFPHAGFPEKEKGPGFEWEDITVHQDLLRGFFKGSINLLRDKNSYVVVTHKTIEPFASWDIPGLGQEAGFELAETIPFDCDHYPGYFNRRGAGKQGGKRFPCEDAVTYKFRLK